MFSFQVSGGATRKCFRKRASVTAKSAKVRGSSMVFSRPSSMYLSSYVGQSSSMSGFISRSKHSSGVLPKSGLYRNKG